MEKREKTHRAKSRGNQFSPSKSSLPKESHRRASAPPGMSGNRCKMFSTRDAYLRTSAQGVKWGLVAQATLLRT